MAGRRKEELLHSVAFRVTEAQWIDLRKRAGQQATSIPQLAKLALFKMLDIELPHRSRSSYGQKPRGKDS
jgi:hypothetical protein